MRITKKPLPHPDMELAGVLRGRSRRVRHLLMISALLLLTVALPVAVLAARGEPLQAAKALATASAPDVSGVWARYPGGGPSRNFLGNFKAPDPPMTPWAEELFKPIKSSYASPDGYLNDPVFKCFPPGVPRIYAVDLQGVMQMVQLPGEILQLFEFDHWVRHIFTDGRQHSSDTGPSWMGDSIGKWRGDTLVVDTTGFNNKTRLDKMGHPHSEALHVVERFRRVSHDNLQLDITIEDPKAYTKPWGGELSFTLEPGWNLGEYVCQDYATFDEFRKQSIGDASK
jgi:hypothetical protein